MFSDYSCNTASALSNLKFGFLEYNFLIRIYHYLIHKSEILKFNFQLYSDSRHLYWNTQVFERPPLIMCNNLKRLEISFNDEHPIVSYNFKIIFSALKYMILLIYL